MKVAFEGLRDTVATFRVNGAIAAGTPVKMSASGTVTACAAGDVLIGVALQSDASYATVRLGGVMTLPYSGTAPALGFTKLVAAGKSVKTGTAGRDYLVLAVDSTASTVTFML